MGKKIKPPNKSLVLLDKPYSLISEQFKKLRAKIFSPQNGKEPRTILVTSSIQGEGKTTIAANLAISISQGLSEHVLLVDCDLRAPSVHKLFTEKPGTSLKGLSDYLTYGEDISHILLKTDIDKLSILPAGKGVDNPAELIASEKMARLIKDMKSRYNDRYIVLDSTPILPTTESTFLANIVDVVIFVVKSGKTPRDLVKKAVNTLKREKILGVVLNDIKKSPINMYKYYHYYYYENRK